MGLIESYIVRRAVCGVQTNTLNKLFIQWAKSFPSTAHAQWLHDAMASGSSARRFPKDAEFADAFLNHQQYGRGSTRFILCRLEKSSEHREIVDLSKATIEHILPQSLSPAWKLELGANAEEIHSNLIGTFGNLTLTAYNGELGNLPFSEKKAKLTNPETYTRNGLNHWIIQQNNWRAVEIEQRAKLLLLKANKIWAGPQS